MDLAGLSPQTIALRLDRAGLDSLVDQSLELMQRVDFSGNEDLEAVVVVHLCRVWSSLGDERQSRILAALPQKIERCRLTNDPIESLTSILSLKRDEDVRRALMVRADQRLKWTPDPHEPIYAKVGGWLGDYVEFAKHNEVPLALHYWAGLAALGAACRRNFYIEYGVSRLYMNQYIVLGSKKGTGKSVAMEAALDVLNRVNERIDRESVPSPELFKINILPEDTTPESLIKDMSNRIAIMEQQRDDGSVEAKYLPIQATAVLAVDELATFLGKGTFSVDKKIPLLTTLWSKDTYHKGTATHGHQTMDDVGLTMLACCAPSWLRGQITQDVFGGGFMDRTHFIYRPVSGREYPLAPPFDPVQAVGLSKYLMGLTFRTMKERAFVRPSTMAWYEDWYSAIKAKARKEAADEDETVTSVSRQAVHLWKQSALLCLSREGWPYVTQDDMELANTILGAEQTFYNEFMNQARRTKDSEYYDFITRLVKKYQVAQGRPMPHAELMQLCKNRIGPSRKTKEYLDTLLVDGTLRRIETNNKGTAYEYSFRPAAD